MWIPRVLLGSNKEDSPHRVTLPQLACVSEDIKKKKKKGDRERKKDVKQPDKTFTCLLPRLSCGAVWLVLLQWWRHKVQLHLEMQLCVAINKMKRTSGSIEVGYPVEDDAVQEQGGSVDLHRAAQETVEDPNVPDVEAQEVDYFYLK